MSECVPTVECVSAVCYEVLPDCDCDGGSIHYDRFNELVHHHIETPARTQTDVPVSNP